MPLSTRIWAQPDEPQLHVSLIDAVVRLRGNLTIEEIQRLTCEYFGIPEELIRAKTRKRCLTRKWRRRTWT